MHCAINYFLKPYLMLIPDLQSFNIVVVHDQNCFPFLRLHTELSSVTYVILAQLLTLEITFSCPPVSLFGPFRASRSALL